jgi:predicted nuclease of predicted toxin-antitoxin system
MRWLLDQGVPRSTSQLMRDEGADVCHTGERGLATAADGQLIDIARAEGRVIVTFDPDCHAILAASNAKSPSVIRIREEGLKSPELVRLIRRIESQFQTELEQGCVLSPGQSEDSTSSDLVLPAATGGSQGHTPPSPMLHHRLSGEPHLWQRRILVIGRAIARWAQDRTGVVAVREP